MLPGMKTKGNSMTVALLSWLPGYLDILPETGFQQFPMSLG